MFARACRKEADYNRGLPAPMRWLRVAWAGAVSPLRPVWDWAGRSWRRDWLRPLLVGLAVIVVLWPIDGWLLRVLAGWEDRLPGDLRRELHALQQFGQGGAIILVMLVIVSLDRAGARRLWDWLAALGLTAAAVYPLKMLLGRPRPGLGADLVAAGGGSVAGDPAGAGPRGEPALEDTLNVLYTPDTFLGPFGVHPFDAPTGFRHAWEFWADISADLWSMPSAHTAYAVVMAVFLGLVYPRVAWLVWIMAALVGVARVIFAAHYPTDVVAGAAIGAAAGTLAVRRRLGQRVVGLERERRGGEAEGGGA
jgi:membrane-associated phospholipid phosphatase